MFVSRGSVKKLHHKRYTWSLPQRSHTDAVEVNCRSYHCICLWLISVVAEGEIEVKKKKKDNNINNKKQTVNLTEKRYMEQ